MFIGQRTKIICLECGRKTFISAAEYDEEYGLYYFLRCKRCKLTMNYTEGDMAKYSLKIMLADKRFVRNH